MSRETKNIITKVLITIALFQGPFLYYFTFGFFKLFGIICFGLIGLILTMILLINILRHKSSNTKYHIIGIIFSSVIGFATISCWPIEYLDWTLRKGERNEIVNYVKKGLLKPNSPLNNEMCQLPGPYVLPISNAGNEILILKYGKGIVHVEFYIDRGFLDHFSAFIYTNDPAEIREYNSEIGRFGGGNVKKLGNSWYRVSY